LEIGSDAVREHGRLADIEDASVPVLEKIYAGLIGKVIQLRLKNIVSHGALVAH
jgi:hypothetical protein